MDIEDYDLRPDDLHYDFYFTLSVVAQANHLVPTDIEIGLSGGVVLLFAALIKLL